MNISFSPPDITEAEVQEVAELCGTSRAVCLGSQAACAEMTLHVLGIGPGDDLIAKEALRSVVPTFRRPEEINQGVK